MSASSIYTRYAKRLANRFPATSYLLTQVTLWVIAYFFLAVITHLFLRIAGSALHAKTNFTATLLVALFFGATTGIVAGLADRLFEKRLFHNRSLGVVIILKAVIHFLVFVILISLVRYSAYPFLQKNVLNNANVITEDQSWEAFFQLLLIFNMAIGILTSFFNQVNKKFGPGVLLPLLFGRYRKPKEEERIFLFMDLNSSTSIAETLGHLKYSAFIRDSFIDINAVLPSYNAQVYQYVGDAIVLTWTSEEGLKKQFCIEFFFACIDRFTKRSAYYLQRYGQVPGFKAGVHIGTVTAVEVGEIKREIAYHGDTLNTAARIQSLCNEYNRPLLVSMELLNDMNPGKNYLIDSLGMVTLKGKVQPVEIAGVSKA